MHALWKIREIDPVWRGAAIWESSFRLACEDRGRMLDNQKHVVDSIPDNVTWYHRRSPLETFRHGEGYGCRCRLRNPEQMATDPQKIRPANEFVNEEA